MNNSKSTNKELVEILEKRNVAGRYDGLITRAKANSYHDYKSDLDTAAPKMQLVSDLDYFPELKDVRQMVIDGEFDESPDADDDEATRKDLGDNMFNAMFKKQ